MDDPRETFRRRQSALCDAVGVDAASREAGVSVTVAVETIHVLDAGPADAESVVFLPGATQPGAAYLPLIASPADEYRCLAVDHPGDGLTDPVDYGEVSFARLTREAYPAALDALGVESAHVLAHSQGGFQAFELAFARPERVRSVAFLGAPGGLARSGPFSFRLLAVPYLGRLLRRAATHDDPAAVRDDWDGRLVTDASAIPTELCALQVANERLPGRVRTQATLSERLWSPLRGTRDRYVYRDRRQSTDPDAGNAASAHDTANTHDTKALDVPTAFVWGTEEFYRPPSLGETVAAELDARFVRLEGAGHTVWLEPGTEAAAELRAFLPG